MAPTVDYTNFLLKLDEIVDHLDRADQLTDDLARKVSALVLRMMQNREFESIRTVTLFQMTIVSESVERTGIPIDVFACLDGKSANYLSLLDEDAEVPEKGLYGDVMDFVKKS